MKTLHMLGLAAVAGAALLLPAQPAQAAGCNGVVNIFVWGCAPWDNNNGSQYPYFNKKAVTLPKQGTQIVDKNGVKFAVRNGQYYPLIGQDGASLIGNDGGSFRVWSQ